jgi:DNA-binding beta-propeller fold protein YncE
MPRIGIFAALCAAFLLCAAGCADSSAKVTKLSFSKISFIQMPVEGIKIPAPRSLAFNRAGELMVLDDVGRVLIFSPEGVLLRKWWMPDHSIGRPEGIIEMKDGRIAVSDTHYYRVVIFSPNGEVDKIFGERGDEPGKFGNPVGVTEDENGDLYVCEYGEHDRVQVFRPDGTFLRSFGKPGTGDGEFQRPSAVLIENDEVFVADAVNNRVQVFAKNGDFIRSITTSPRMYLPYDVKLGPKGNLYVVEYGNNRIDKLTSDGELLASYTMEKDGFKTPWGLAVDSKGRVFVADTGNRRIVILTP